MRIQILFWVFSIFIGFGFHLVSGQCLNDQKSLLIQLKNSIQVNSSGWLLGWDQSSDCCSWEGVSCDQGGLGFVTGLHLPEKSITAGIEKIFSLRNLQSLNLAFNKLNSTIPREVGQLTSLRSLNFSNAGFKGQVPVEVARLTRLVSLDLSNSNAFLNNIPVLQLENPGLVSLVGNLLKLEELYVDGNNISANGNEFWRSLSSSLPRLRVLSMPKCSLSGSIDSSLSNLQSLSIIHLDNNNFTAPFPDFFAGFSSLTSLHLGSSGLFGDVLEKIFLVSTLQDIDLSDNARLQGSLPEFPSNSSLRILKLSRTRFSGMLPKSIGNLEMLSVIELTGCNFSGSIPKSMKNLTKLVSVDLSSNALNGTIPSFSMSKNLTQIILSRNRLSGPVSPHWEGLESLGILDFGNNTLEGNIPEAIFSLPSLKKIQLQNNLFSGQLNIPNVSAPYLLDTLDLSSNNLEGSVPESVFSLQGLKILSLSFNNLSGSFHLYKIHQMKNLSVLDLSHNSLSVTYLDTDPAVSFPNISTLKLASCELPTFPKFIKGQPKLQHLDLSMNRIQGDVPVWIWKLSLVQLNLAFNSLTNLEGPVDNMSSSLRVLDLHSNQLQGPIKIPAKSASYLDYSSNRFTSSIPKEIGTFLTVAGFLSLSNNNFSGEIPESICKGHNLQVINLSNNSLSGQIPKCLMEMSGTLGVLNLRRNNISGAIPDTFTGNCIFKTLDLSGNQLEGKIPKSLANCKLLEVLDLGNNQINDIFPCHLKKNSTSLRVLVLRSNHFHGQIGCPNINATWKKLQIADLASNNFSGELPDKCLATWEAMINREDFTMPDVDQIQFSVLSLSNWNYQDTVTVTIKGIELEIVKILTVYTSIDLSCNNLVGPIPQVFGTFKALYALNLSHNALTGGMHSTLGNLSGLESLDLSNNELTGKIPAEIGKLTFLSYLNLSYNQLVGMIPTSTQLQSFSESSYEGNKGLCGPPMSKICSISGISPTTISDSPEDSGTEFDWRFIYTGLGFGVGAALIVAPLMFCRRFRDWYDDLVDRILLVLLPMIGLKYTTREDQEGEEDEDTKEYSSEGFSDHEDYAANYSQSLKESEKLQGVYCIFCSKLDTTRKRAIHNLTCTCHNSPPSSCFCSLSSSSHSS